MLGRIGCARVRRLASGGYALRLTSVICFSFFVLVACKPPEETDESTTNEGTGTSAEIFVETVTVNTTNFREIIELVGETEALRTAGVSARIPGQITEFNLQVGDEVTEGDTVLRIDTRAQRSQVGGLEVQIRQLEADIARTQRLIDQGLANEMTLEQLTTARDALLEGINSVDTAVGLGRTRAPISGVVIETLAEEGEFGAPGFPVARIADMSTVVARVGLPERDIRFVREGMLVNVHIEALELDRPGIVHRVGLEAVPGNRTFPVEVYVDNAARDLRIGLRATVQLTKQELRDVVVIPRDVVLRGVEGQEVFVVEDDLASTRSIELGPGRGRFVVVLSGLSPGDQLVTRGQRGLLDGRPVSATNTGECCREQLLRLDGPETDPEGPLTNAPSSASETEGL